MECVYDFGRLDQNLKLSVRRKNLLFAKHQLMQANAVLSHDVEGVFLIDIDTLRENDVLGELEQVDVGELSKVAFDLVRSQAFKVHFPAKQRLFIYKTTVYCSELGSLLSLRSDVPVVFEHILEFNVVFFET
jgi:hypothetical protein